MTISTPAPLITTPTSIDDALAILANAAPPLDTPTQRQIFGLEHQRGAFDRGNRRPSWVWSAPGGVIAAWGPSGGDIPWMIDLLAVDDAEVGRALLERAVADMRALGADEFEVNLFVPAAEDPASGSGVAPLIDMSTAAGFELLVPRRLYELDPVATPPASQPTTLRFEQATDIGDPRLREIYREFLVDSLDAHDQAAVERFGLHVAAERALQDELLGVPIAGFHLVFDPEDALVGLAVGTVRNGRGVAAQFGVAHEHRGRGYAAQMLGWITDRLVEQGAPVIIAATDNANLPMAAAFARVGYPQTESRIDLTYPFE